MLAGGVEFPHVDVVARWHDKSVFGPFHVRAPVIDEFDTLHPLPEPREGAALLLRALGEDYVMAGSGAAEGEIKERALTIY
jgi:hypothetical protein